jgi:AcrR family transcriptional regulator
MREPADELHPEDEALAGPEGYGRLHDVVTRELGDEAARMFSTVTKAWDTWEQSRRPGEGLRERKKRVTRQRISDVASALFVGRGFDAVRVAEIAEAAGVSEKTIYNYFPNKESLVFDQADEQLAKLADRLRNRPPGASPSRVVVDVLSEEAARLSAVTENQHLDFLPAFGAMIRNSPALRAAWSEHRHRLVETVAEILAADAGVDPRDPEPFVAACALVSIFELYYGSTVRHIADGAAPEAFLGLVQADLKRAARLLDSGLWSFHVMVEGRRTKQQLRDAAAAAEQTRQQVMRTLREAKRTWRELRDEQRTLVREQHRPVRPGRRGR